MFSWYNRKMWSFQKKEKRKEKNGDQKLYTTNDLILVTKGYLVDLNLLHSYEGGSGITEKECIENQCGI